MLAQRSILNRLTHAFDTDIIIHQLDWAHLTELITWFGSPTHTGADVLIIPEVTDVTHLRTDLICHKCAFLTNDVSHFRRQCAIAHGQPMHRRLHVTPAHHMTHDLPQCKYCHMTFTTWRSF